MDGAPARACSPHPTEPVAKLSRDEPLALWFRAIFEVTASKQGSRLLVLDARWVILQQPEARVLASPSAQIRVPAVGEGIPDVVAAISPAAVQLSEQIAADTKR